MNLAGRILKLFGWTVRVSVPDYPKCIICVAPHTSNWDFIIGKLAYASVRRKAGFLMKDTWFFWPLGCFFRAIGGLPVPRRKRGERPLTDIIVARFEEADRLAIAITPEGTRSRTCEWHTFSENCRAGAGAHSACGYRLPHQNSENRMHLRAGRRC